jgi:hypothetical protein
MRLILALIWLSLSLVIASGPAFAVPSPGCLKAYASSMADGHDRMADAHRGSDCCTENCSPDCAAVCPATIMTPELAVVEPAGPGMEQRTAWPPTMLKFAILAATDPPPRTIFS